MKSRRKYPPKKGLQSPPREQSIEDIAEVFGVHPDTAREWVKDGCPASKPKGAYRLNDGEVHAWLTANGRSTKPGRPPKEKDATADPEQNKDYWLARKYKIQALQAEGELIPKDDVRQIGAMAFGLYKNAMLAMPAKLAVQLEGMTAAERQELLQSEITHQLDELSRNLRELGGRGNTTKAA